MVVAPPCHPAPLPSRTAGRDGEMVGREGKEVNTEWWGGRVGLDPEQKAWSGARPRAVGSGDRAGIDLKRPGEVEQGWTKSSGGERDVDLGWTWSGGGGAVGPDPEWHGGVWSRTGPRAERGVEWGLTQSGGSRCRAR